MSTDPSASFKNEIHEKLNCIFAIVDICPICIIMFLVAHVQ